jgi:hypothetical protein
MGFVEKGGNGSEFTNRSWMRRNKVEIQ